MSLNLLHLIVATAIFAVALVLIIKGKIDRSIVALLGAIAVVVAGTYLGFFSQSQALTAIDWSTVGLLLGMMIIVEILRRTGLFRFLAVWGARLAGGNAWFLLIFFCLITALTSMIIDNVTTILLMAPVMILVCDMLGIEPVPFLLFQTFFSNIGGMGTLVGDPPNIMIGSAAGFGFNSFIIHLMPIALIAMLATFPLARMLFPGTLKKSRDRKQEVAQMSPQRSITDPRLLKLGVLALGAVVALFALESIIGLQPAFVALMGAIVTLAITRISPTEILKNIDWSTLFFFIGLFIMVGALRSSGLTQLLGAEIGALAANNLILSAVAVMWISAMICTVVNRIPYTAAMIPVIGHIAATGINVTPLWWALALGVGLGGNAAPFGTTAGIAMMGISERTAHPISFRVWLRSGMLVTLVTTGIATAFLLAFFGWYTG